MTDDEKTAIVRVGDEREVTSAEKFDALELAETQALDLSPSYLSPVCLPISFRGPDSFGEISRITFTMTRTLRVDHIYGTDSLGGRGTEVELLLLSDTETAGIGYKKQRKQRIRSCGPSDPIAIGYTMLSGEQIVLRVKFFSGCEFFGAIYGRGLI